MWLVRSYSEKFATYLTRKLLIFLPTTGISYLETLTSTDMVQAWGKLKKTPMYKHTRVRDLCHVPTPRRQQLSKEDQARIRAKPIATAPNIPLARHETGRCHEREELEPLEFSCHNSGMEPMLVMKIQGIRTTYKSIGSFCVILPPLQMQHT